jgi:NAD(P)-dependent dehydrogenase (short-subunit alcohol dehydrogenase family)
MKIKSFNSLFRLDGKVIVITGAGGLLGKKHAEVIAAFGGSPVLLDLHEGPIKKLAGELTKKYSVSAITNEEEIFSSCNQIINQFGKIDGLVNNAANNPKVEDSSKTNFSRLESFPIATWNQDILVGLTGAYLCSKHYGAQIAKNPNGGSIINISSDLGLMGPDQRLYMKPGVADDNQPVKPVSYSVVKTGLLGLTRYLATYWADRNVRCNALCPGGVENGQPEHFMNEVCLRIPMGRLAQSGEYQGVLVFMLSDASSYLNGAVIPVDGGRTAW